MSADPKGRAKGGLARAAKLSPERRREIARQAAAARWSGASPARPRKANPDVALRRDAAKLSVLDQRIATLLGRLLDLRQQRDALFAIVERRIAARARPKKSKKETT